MPLLLYLIVKYRLNSYVTNNLSSNASQMSHTRADHFSRSETAVNSPKKNFLYFFRLRIKQATFIATHLQKRNLSRGSVPVNKGPQKFFLVPIQWHSTSCLGLCIFILNQILNRDFLQLTDDNFFDLNDSFHNDADALIFTLFFSMK